jgi:hypothetical protein
LAMGWFEFYFFHLDIIEIPVMILILHVIDWVSRISVTDARTVRTI